MDLSPLLDASNDDMPPVQANKAVRARRRLRAAHMFDMPPRDKPSPNMYPLPANRRHCDHAAPGGCLRTLLPADQALTSTLHPLPASPTTGRCRQ